MTFINGKRLRHSVPGGHTTITEGMGKFNVKVHMVSQPPIAVPGSEARVRCVDDATGAVVDYTVAVLECSQYANIGMGTDDYIFKSNILAEEHLEAYV